ncbi:MAG: squalene/phytoene synthase family protein [Chloroflexi bacterium]|nr:squalene/phytoene synthase family protein [Chloroflexota bacterium]MCC6893991.1 squalene/phytoene synthase family protein [Anaerolineae bacterium]
MRLEIPVESWEHQLLAWAREPLQSLKLPHHVKADSALLTLAYKHCVEITRHHSKTFYLASALLPSDKRRAARALYAFCRVTDDLVDRSDGSDVLNLLEAWQLKVSSHHPDSSDLVALAWADTRARYKIPAGYAEQLITGVGRDINQKRYATFADLAEYSYGVASTVGLMAMHIIGFHSEAAVPYAVKLGVALQLTNILRDVGEDWRAGRLYLPQDELAHFGLTEADIAAEVTDDRWQRFMAFQINRNRQLYDEAQFGIRMLNADGRFAIAAAAGLYRAILDDIEARQGDIFRCRAHVSSAGKLRRLPSIWWQSRQV